MTITASINTVGIVRATEMLQSTRTEAAFDHRQGPHTVSVEIARSTEAEAHAQADGRQTPPSQKRVVDIRV